MHSRFLPPRPAGVPLAVRDADALPDANVGLRAGLDHLGVQEAVAGVTVVGVLPADGGALLAVVVAGGRVVGLPAEVHVVGVHAVGVLDVEGVGGTMMEYLKNG